jgi:hypothetical protein
VGWASTRRCHAPQQATREALDTEPLDQQQSESVHGQGLLHLWLCVPCLCVHRQGLLRRGETPPWPKGHCAGCRQ